MQVESRRGQIHAPARISGTRPGVVFVPFHYGYFDSVDEDGSDRYARAANETTRTEWDPVSKQPVFKVTAVRVRKLASGAEAQKARNASGSSPTNGESAKKALGSVADVSTTAGTAS